MTGTKRPGFVLQDRDRHLLSELAVMRIADREAAKVVAGFTSTTRANTRLLAYPQRFAQTVLHREYRRWPQGNVHVITQGRGTGRRETRRYRTSTKPIGRW